MEILGRAVSRKLLNKASLLPFIQKDVGELLVFSHQRDNRQSDVESREETRGRRGSQLKGWIGAPLQSKYERRVNCLIRTQDTGSIQSFPLDGSGWLAADIVHNPVYPAHFIDDTVGE